jgi:hypothetical protein
MESFTICILHKVMCVVFPSATVNHGKPAVMQAYVLKVGWNLDCESCVALTAADVLDVPHWKQCSYMIHMVKWVFKRK